MSMQKFLSMLFLVYVYILSPVFLQGMNQLCTSKKGIIAITTILTGLTALTKYLQKKSYEPTSMPQPILSPSTPPPAQIPPVTTPSEIPKTVEISPVQKILGSALIGTIIGAGLQYTKRYYKKYKHKKDLRNKIKNILPLLPPQSNNALLNFLIDDYYFNLKQHIINIDKNTNSQQDFYQKLAELYKNLPSEVTFTRLSGNKKEKINVNITPNIQHLFINDIIVPIQQSEGINPLTISEIYTYIYPHTTLEKYIFNAIKKTTKISFWTSMTIIHYIYSFINNIIPILTTLNMNDQQIIQWLRMHISQQVINDILNNYVKTQQISKSMQENVLKDLDLTPKNLQKMIEERLSLQAPLA